MITTVFKACLIMNVAFFWENSFSGLRETCSIYYTIHDCCHILLPNDIEENMINPVRHAARLHTNTASMLRQMQFMGIMQTTNSTLCFHNFESKPRVVALFQLHVNFLILDYHLMLQVPTSASTELSDDGIAVAEEVDVKVGVRTRL